MQQRLIEDDVRYIAQVPTVMELLQYMNQNRNLAPRIQQGIHQKLSEFDVQVDKTLLALIALLNHG